MPTSATGISAIERAVAPPAARTRGFTLLEILVVVAIIGIVTAGVLLSFNLTGRDPALKTESRRLLTLMRYARSQAELQTRDYGIVFTRQGYEFLVYSVRRGQWRPVTEDRLLRKRHLPAGLAFQVAVDARRIDLKSHIATDPQALDPQVMLFSSGDLSSFEITLKRADAGRSITLRENQDGRIVENRMMESGT